MKFRHKIVRNVAFAILYPYARLKYGIKIEKFKEHPEVGVPLYGPLINTVTRGARLKKFYLRSAATGIGKTRSMIADCCYIGCNKLYDENFGIIYRTINE